MLKQTCERHKSSLLPLLLPSLEQQNDNDAVEGVTKSYPRLGVEGGVTSRNRGDNLSYSTVQRGDAVCCGDGGHYIGRLEFI